MQKADRREKKTARIMHILCVCICCVLWAGTAHAAEAEEVRVGVYNTENYVEPGQDVLSGGYEYEYLMKIASYTGWKYEFVTGSLDECLGMLERGEIDLLCNLEKTPERERLLSYCDTATMFVSGCLLQPAEKERYTFEDFDSFDGMRIGAVKASSLNDALREYSREKGFTYELIEYDTGAEVKQALKTGEVEAACLGSNRDLSQFSVLAYFGYSPRYAASSPKRPELALRLDEALKEIWVREPEFEYELFDKYFSFDHNIALTRKEQEYLQKHREPVHVGLYMDIGRLLCRYDKKNDEYCGIAVDVMEMISERTGIDFVYEEIPQGGTPGSYLEEHPDAIAAPSLINSLISHDSGYMHLNPIIKGRMLTVTRIGEPVDLNGKFRLAVPGALYSQADLLGRVFPNAEFISCERHRDGLDMVVSKEADMALVNEITAAYQLQSPLRSNLQTSRLVDIVEDLTVGLSYDADAELVSILNKAIVSIGERDARQIVVNNTASVSYDMSFKEWCYKNRISIVLFVLLVFFIVFFTIQIMQYRNHRARERQELLQAEERLKVEMEYQKKLYQQANYDELTGIYNGNSFVRQADRLLKENPDKVYTFLQINLVKFKMLNDLYGIEAGDQVLRTLAELLRTLVGKRGAYGRLYADQFAVCMPLKRDKLKDYFWNNGILMVEYQGKKIRAELEIGIYVDERHCLDAAQAMDYAKIALGSEGETEKGYLHYFKNETLEALRRQQRITNEMEKALREEQFQVYLQPQFNITSNRLVGAEALVRWKHPKQGMISPGEFIPVFEQNRFIYQLDAYMCDKICAILAEWMKEGKAVPVSMNLSQVDLKNPELVSMLERTLKKYDVPISYLHLEITESAYFDDRKMLKQIIDKLHSLGFCIEMDDFGSGYSSLNMLKDIPVDVLKLDVKFLEGEEQMSRSGSIINSVLNMAHSVGMLVIVEGVETDRQVSFLRSIGCNFVQGYLMGRPMPVTDFKQVMDTSVLGEKYLEIPKEDDAENEH